MAKPIAQKVIPFDNAIAEGVIKFSYDGAQPYGHDVIIYDAETGDKVVETTVSNYMRLEHVVPIGTLAVDKQYMIQLRFFDVGHEYSAWSDTSYFWVLNTPTLIFNDFPLGNTEVTPYTVKHGSQSFPATFTQTGGDSLTEYTYTMTDLSSSLASTETSGILHDTNITWTFKNLENDHVYHVICTGITNLGMTVSSPDCYILVKYTRPSMYSLIYLSTDNNTGVVTYRSNFAQHDATRDDYGYLYGDTMIDLTNDVVEYENFLLEDTFCINFKNKLQEGRLMELSNRFYVMTVDCILCTDGRYRYKLVVPGGVCNSILYSEPISADINDFITCYVQKENGMYQIVIFNNGGVS